MKTTLRLLAIVSAVLYLLLAASWLLAQQKRPAKPVNPLAGIPSGQTRVVDLAYAISEKLVPWPGDTHPFEARIKATVEKNGYFTRSFCMLEHYGTHLDAPAHFPPGKLFVDQIPPERLFGPAVVLDVRAEVERNPDHRLSAARIEQWEKAHGYIPPGSIVLLRTGWATRWPDVNRYRNMDAFRVMHFPGYAVEAVKLLIERQVSGLGIDTLSVDYGPSKQFEVHKLSHGAGLYHVENLSDLGALPEAGAFLVVAPIKLAGGSGGPCRVFAILPSASTSPGR
jgi:kynurenine formamidase